LGKNWILLIIPIYAKVSNNIIYADFIFSWYWIFYQIPKIVVSGAVQGVGFRPFVYNIAQQLGVVGEVYNDTQHDALDSQRLYHHQNRHYNKFLY
jgi:hypothetical protein